MYVKAACFVEKRIISEEELRSGVPCPPPRPLGAKKKSGSAPPTAPPTAPRGRGNWADMSAKAEDDTASDTDAPNFWKEKTTETGATEELRAGEHVRALEQQLEEGKKREAVLAAALSESEAGAEQWKQLAGTRERVALIDAGAQTTDADEEGPGAVLRDVLRILAIESSDPNSRISFVLDNYRHHLGQATAQTRKSDARGV
jgi:hypothetical protein